ncbi:hypothetical protein EXIGLDRAFT_156116 [Exidia glandulosa HHB12029]|uniref:Uncharacterized protein n=1 Tax=Exidia glandulosa HHB12029 TaxID=1314781 RepID=A0A165N7S4_EXIGL|nr:hypothetical protein EXIGLDRAFT_156116 [Exidia glandulosa HHB12029]
MVRLGHALEGRYKQNVEEEDDCAGLPEAVIEKRYGTCGRPKARPDGHIGAGDSDNEDDDAQRTSRKVWSTVEQNVKHDAVEVPAETCPFSDAASGERFQKLWNQLREMEFIPRGFGLTPEELEQSPYPSHESIRHGKGRSKMLEVPLPHDPWKARAELWAVSLYALERFLVEK